MVKVPADKVVVVLHKGEVREVHIGFSVFVNPLTETVKYIPVDVRTVDLKITNVESSVKDERANYYIEAVAQVKVTTDKEILTRNAHRLIGMTNEQINSAALKVLEDVLRRYAKHKTMMEVSENREDTARWVMGWANDELNPQAFEVRSFVIKDVMDMSSYLDVHNPDYLDQWFSSTD